MSESGGFGGGGGGGFSGDSSFSFGGASESGTFGSTGGGWGGGGGWDSDTRRSSGHYSTSPFVPAIEGGVLGYMLGRSTAPGAGGYYSQVPAPSPYSPIVPGAAVQYTGAPPVVVGYYPGGTGDYSPEERDRRQRRKLLKWGFAAACFAAFCLYFILFSSRIIELRDKEQHLFTANTLFAAGITFSPPRSFWELNFYPQQQVSFQTAVYTFPSRPNPTKTDQFRLGQQGVEVKRYGYQAWPVWLNRGSSVQIQYSVPYSSSTPLELVIVRGRKEMEDWKDNPRGKDDEAHGVLVEHPMRGSGSYSFTSKRDALYFFALANFAHNPVTCDFYLDVTSTVYDLSRATHRCDMSSEASRPCEVDLPLGQARYAVLQSAEGNDPLRPKRNVQVSYKPRTISYVVLLASPWLLLGVLTLLQRARAPEGQAPASSGAGSGTVTTSSATGAGAGAGLAAAGAPSSSATWQQGRSSVPQFPTQNLAAAAADSSAPKAPIPSTWVPSKSAQPVVGPTVTTESSSVVAPSAPRLDDDLATAGGGAASGRDLKPEDACAICMEAPKDAVILDCGHRATCLSCGKMLQGSRNPQCPICRQPIRHVTKVYDV